MGFFTILMKWSVFEPSIYGRRAPEHYIKYFGVTKNYSWGFASWNYIPKWVPSSPSRILCKKLDFCSFWGQWRTFGTAVRRWRPAGRPTKNFGRSATTFKHLSIILECFEDSKGSSQKKLTPPKRSFFWGGVIKFNMTLNPVCF